MANDYGHTVDFGPYHLLYIDSTFEGNLLTASMNKRSDDIAENLQKHFSFLVLDCCFKTDLLNCKLSFTDLKLNQGTEVYKKSLHLDMMLSLQYKVFI